MKNSNFLKALIVVIALTLVGVGFLMKINPHIFNFNSKDKEVAAEIVGDELYNRIINTDLFDAYPTTPEDVVTLYEDTMLVLYSPEVTDETMLRNVLSKQRALYAESLIELNDVDAQFDELMASRATLFEQNMVIDHFEHVKTEIENEENYGELSVTNTIQHLQNGEKLYFNFYLQKDADGRYKVLLRDKTNKNFYRVVS